MAKARMALNEKEARIVELGRTMSKLMAKRRGKQDDLAAVDKEIAVTNRQLLELIGTPAAPPMQEA